MLFLGGPCTIGPGQVIGLDLVETLRSYHDILKGNDNTKYMKNSTKYYLSLTQRAIKCQMVWDLWGFSLDQFGLVEMKPLAEKTGGYIIIQESFSSDVFTQSFQKMFEREQTEGQQDEGDLRMAFCGRTDLFLSKELKVCGAIGPCTSLKKSSPIVSEVEIGQGSTSAWYLGGIDRCTTVAFYFDLGAQGQNSGKIQPGKIAYFQYQTSYRHSSGKLRVRVTTIARPFSDDLSMQQLSKGFDQEAACVTMARLGILKAENEEHLEVLKWLDRSLIRLVSRFAQFKRDDPSSFRLEKEFTLFPQFMFHLRRSHFLQIFGITPDEAVNFRSTLLRENVTNSLVMIQPALLSYSFENPAATPVHLDQESLKPNVILLLDAYFKVIVWHGTHIKQWEDQDYQNQPEYANFKELLEAPQEDVKLIVEDRFPTPWIIKSYQGDGVERHIKSKVNPSGYESQMQGGDYINDDANLKLFMDHLIRFAVQTLA
eukprot:TRINITY_DN4251_c0_g1_i1.p1 TRINITY_DN4251_c0_g1~~TRINITY_DN4251_c0_g1_i1.p1  ORF type:complete len:484 (+),score=73.58 TRINITY_DN4251_c0_g1_i1:179-1630(+)